MPDLPRLPPERLRRALAAAARAFLHTLYGGVSTSGLDQIPTEGALIVAATHESWLDPVLLAAFVPRRLHFMAKRQLFAVPLLGTLIERLGAFPIDRGTPGTRPFRTALGILSQGGAVVVFPQGGVARKLEGRRFKAGIGSLAARSQAPILPLLVSGSRKLASGPTSLRIGPLVKPTGERPGRRARFHATRRTLAALAAAAQERDHARPA